MGREENNCPCEPKRRSTITKRNKRYPLEEPTGAGEPEVGCSGKCCRSCTAGVIADCVAVCCCPCAVVNIFTLTFLKLPWMIGRKCLGLGNKKKQRLKDEDHNGTLRKDEGLETKISETLKGLELEEQEEIGEYSARLEAEKVWLELYKVDQFGFGRVSFTGIQSLE
ncbi:uncharacterized protein [Rutidosis leptorrhynchoides]|uniref:uncharacterized protein n=1 Tax=Rutidosis leptorrhynchoides TaxID=125765 RepID=UPI003A9A15E0